MTRIQNRQGDYDHKAHVRIFIAVPILLNMQTVHGASGHDNYSSSAQKPAGYIEAVTLIAAEKYQDAIASLQSAEKLTKNDADVQNLL